MTREKAIRWLTNEKWKNANNKYKKEWNEAFDMAIEALQTAEINCVHCPHYYETEDDTGVHGYCRMDTAHTDLINRADVIGAVHEYYQKRFTEDSKWDADAKMFVLEDKTIAKDNMEICNIINALPSADTVMRDATAEERSSVQRYIDSISTEAVQVVRCKDCRHRNLFSCPLADNDFQKDEDFCSWGERKEEGIEKGI